MYSFGVLDPALAGTVDRGSDVGVVDADGVVSGEVDSDPEADPHWKDAGHPAHAESGASSAPFATITSSVSKVIGAWSAGFPLPL